MYSNEVERLGRFLYWGTLLILGLSVILPLLATYQHTLIELPGSIPLLRNQNLQVRYPFRTACFNGTILAIALLLPLLARPVYKKLFWGLAVWLKEPSERYARITVFALVSLSLIAFFLKLHMIFVLRGNPGWTYKHMRMPTTEKMPPNYPDTEPPEFLEAALNRSALPYIKGEGLVQGMAYFVHFKDGSQKPFNLNLLRITHPNSRFGIRLDMEQQAFASIFKRNYALRQKGFSNFLPASLALPTHIDRQTIDYTQYPPLEEVVYVTAWIMLLKVNGGTSVELFRANKLNEIQIG